MSYPADRQTNKGKNITLLGGGRLQLMRYGFGFENQLKDDCVVFDVTHISDVTGKDRSL